MDNLGFGLQVTVLGLGIVFGLLALLWLLLTIAVRLDGRGASAESGSPAEGPSPRVAIRPIDGGAEVSPQLVAAIAVAIRRHADQRRRQAAPVMRSYWPGSLLFASRWVAAGRTRQSQSWHRRGR
jgi:Na+-transporting methylmalonyl-CoA/oxaloacetate decarboxylase gamma subunit